MGRECAILGGEAECGSTCVPRHAGTLQQTDFSCRHWWIKSVCCNGTKAHTISSVSYFDCFCQSKFMTQMLFSILAKFFSRTFLYSRFRYGHDDRGTCVNCIITRHHMCQHSSRRLLCAASQATQVSRGRNASRKSGTRSSTLSPALISSDDREHGEHEEHDATNNLSFFL